MTKTDKLFKLRDELRALSKYNSSDSILVFILTTIIFCSVFFIVKNGVHDVVTFLWISLFVSLIVLFFFFVIVLVNELKIEKTIKSFFVENKKRMMKGSIVVLKAIFGFSRYVKNMKKIEKVEQEAYDLLYSMSYKELKNLKKEDFQSCYSDRSCNAIIEEIKCALEKKEKNALEDVMNEEKDMLIMIMEERINQKNNYKIKIKNK